MSSLWFRKRPAPTVTAARVRRPKFKPGLVRLEDRVVPDTTVATVQINDGSAQRSEVRSITTTFSTSVHFVNGNSNAAAAFQLQRASDGTDVGLTAAVTTDGQGRTVVTLTFSGRDTDPMSALNGGTPSLADGRYQMTIFSGDVICPGTRPSPLDGAGDGVPGTNYVSPTDTPGGGAGQLQLYRMFGDINGDGSVDQLDLAQFRSALNASVGNPLYVAALDADNSDTIDQLDLAQFRTRFNNDVFAIPTPPTFYVNPATGNDANDGRTPATAWKTWAKLVSAVADGTITGGQWVDSEGDPAGISTIPTDADKQAWYAAYLAGQMQLTGAHIYIDTSEAPLQVTAPLILPPGCEIESATNSLTNLEVNVPISSTEVWVQPNAAADPQVWGTTSSTSYAYTGLYEQVNGQWAQLLPIGYNEAVSTLAEALPQLEANPGSFWVDPETNRLYTHAISGGNPNIDGVARQYVPAWATTLGGRIIDVTGGDAYLIGGDGGFGFDPTTSQAAGTAGIGSGEWNDISIIDSCEWSRAGKHTFSAVGTQADGFVMFRDDTAEEGPGAVFVGYWTHFVDYTSFSGIGANMSIYDGDVTVNGWANVDAPGGSDANPSYLALISHSNDSTESFSERLIENCNFGGTVSLGGPETALAIMQDTTIGGALVTDAATSIINRSKMEYRLPSFDGATAIVTDSIFVPGTFYTGAPGDMQGTVTLNRCTFDFTQGNNYSTAWTRTGSVTMSITNGVILDIQNEFYGLVSNVLPTDSITIDHSLIQGSPAFFLVQDYDNVGETVTYGNALSGTPGLTVTNTLFVANAELDPTTYVPLPGSPAIGQSIPVTDAPDYTGEIWAERVTAGALEAQSAVTAMLLATSPPGSTLIDPHTAESITIGRLESIAMSPPAAIDDNFDSLSLP